MHGISTRRILFWGSFASFVCVAVATHWDPSLLEVNDTTGRIRAVLLVVWLAFTGYSIYCIPHESLWRSAQAILKLYWGRQVTADLYISVFLSIGLVWLVTRSAAETVLWSVFIVPFANLAILLFIILRLDDITRAFQLQ